jgi:hypothetical protein
MERLQDIQKFYKSMEGERIGCKIRLAANLRVVE